MNEQFGQDILIEDLRQYCLFLTARENPDHIFVEGKHTKFERHPKVIYFEYVKMMH
jgi:hypothetical protein